MAVEWFKMMKEKILDKKFIPLIQVKELLKERSKEGELTYEQSLTLKYADRFSKLPRVKSQKLLAELKGIEGVDEKLAIKLVDILPMEKEILDLLISKELKISDDDKKKILSVISSAFAEKKAKSKKK